MNVDKAIFAPDKTEAVQLRTALIKLRQENKVTNDHIAVMEHYLKRGTPPDPKRVKEMRSYQVWSDLLRMLREQCGGNWFHEFA